MGRGSILIASALKNNVKLLIKKTEDRPRSAKDATKKADDVVPNLVDIRKSAFIQPTTDR